MASVGYATDPPWEYSERLNDKPLALVRRADGGNGLFLLLDPMRMSEMFNHISQRICNEEVLVLLKWEAINGFLAVESEALEFMGSIRASHIEYVQYREVHYRQNLNPVRLRGGKLFELRSLCGVNRRGHGRSCSTLLSSLQALRSCRRTLVVFGVELRWQGMLG